MAVWGNVSSRGVAEDAKAAARAALGMRRELLELNRRWHREGYVPFAVGIGINQGDVLIGNIGSSGAHERLDPTVIGDAVNLASRLEALTRIYAVDILVGPTASDLIRDAFHLRSVACVQVKGKSEPVEVTTLVGARDANVDSQLLRSLEEYEQGIRAFRAREFAERRCSSHAFSSSIPLITWRRLIWSARCSTSSTRRMNPGARRKFSRRSKWRRRSVGLGQGKARCASWGHRAIVARSQIIGSEA